jgi:hypothetical protein
MLISIVGIYIALLIHYWTQRHCDVVSATGITTVSTGTRSSCNSPFQSQMQMGEHMLPHLHLDLSSQFEDSNRESQAQPRSASVWMLLFSERDPATSRLGNNAVESRRRDLDKGHQSTNIAHHHAHRL